MQTRHDGRSGRRVEGGARYEALHFLRRQDPRLVSRQAIINSTCRGGSVSELGNWRSSAWEAWLSQGQRPLYLLLGPPYGGLLGGERREGDKQAPLPGVAAVRVCEGTCEPAWDGVWMRVCICSCVFAKGSTVRLSLWTAACVRSTGGPSVCGMRTGMRVGLSCAHAFPRRC